MGHTMTAEDVLDLAKELSATARAHDWTHFDVLLDRLARDAEEQDDTCYERGRADGYEEGYQAGLLASVPEVSDLGPAE